MEIELKIIIIIAIFSKQFLFSFILGKIYYYYYYYYSLLYTTTTHLNYNTFIIILSLVVES